MSHAMTQLYIRTKTWSAQVKITVFHAQIITAICVLLNSEWRYLALIKHLER